MIENSYSKVAWFYAAVQQMSTSVMKYFYAEQRRVTSAAVYFDFRDWILGNCILNVTFVSNRKLMDQQLGILSLFGI